MLLLPREISTAGLRSGLPPWSLVEVNQPPWQHPHSVPSTSLKTSPGAPRVSLKGLRERRNHYFHPVNDKKNKTEQLRNSLNVRVFYVSFYTEGKLCSHIISV